MYHFPDTEPVFHELSTCDEVEKPEDIEPDIPPMTPPVLGHAEAAIEPELVELLTVPRDRSPTTPPTLVHPVIGVMSPLLAESNTPQSSVLELVVKAPTMPPTRAFPPIDPENCASETRVRLLVDVHAVEEFPSCPKIPPV
jgi:hypothetical protein